MEAWIVRDRSLPGQCERLHPSRRRSLDTRGQRSVRQCRRFIDDYGERPGTGTLRRVSTLAGTQGPRSSGTSLLLVTRSSASADAPA